MFYGSLWVFMCACVSYVWPIINSHFYDLTYSGYIERCFVMSEFILVLYYIRPKDFKINCQKCWCCRIYYLKKQQNTRKSDAHKPLFRHSNFTVILNKNNDKEEMIERDDSSLALTPRNSYAIPPKTTIAN